MTIHTFGDSHCHSAMPSYVNSHHIGPLLCYSFGKDRLGRIDIRNFGVKNGDSIIFCLGEIDCRCHIHKYVNATKSFQIIINDIVDNYMEAIKINIVESRLHFKHVCVYNVVPPVEKHNTADHPMYPYAGSDAERKQYVEYFNQRLIEKCKEFNYLFFDVYKNYVDANGFLCKDLSDGTVHIQNGKYVEEFIQTHITSSDPHAGGK